MDVWIIWLVAACILGVGEMHQGGFYLAPFAIGAALATVVSLLGVGALLSALAFLLASGIVFGTLRPWLAATAGCLRRSAPARPR